MTYAHRTLVEDVCSELHFGNDNPEFDVLVKPAASAYERQSFLKALFWRTVLIVRSRVVISVD